MELEFEIKIEYYVTTYQLRNNHFIFIETLLEIGYKKWSRRNDRTWLIFDLESFQV